MADGGPLILASASPRRRELLERVGMDLDTRPSSIDESALPGEDAVAHARRLAAAKAEDIAGRAPGRWVLGADTVVEVDGAVLGKPTGERDALRMLASLSGRTHRVTTAFALRGPARYCCDRYLTTEVVMRAFDDREARDYVDSGEWRGKAGAYAVQGMAAAFVTEVRGSITNVIGLPLAEVVEELGRAGAARPIYSRGVPS
jgi:septum formation protein